MSSHRHKKRSVLNEPLLPPPAKLPRTYDELPANDDSQQLIAEHYSNRSNQTVQEREASPIIHLKKLNNWIKSVLIQLYAKKNDSVIDIACGKGGDLIKWDKAKVSYYVGIDLAKGSIEDARTRYNGDASHKSKSFSFPARLIHADCFTVHLDEVLQDEGPFDICSCQFALHYSWASEEKARVALQNVSAVLKPGGYFIGTMPDANVIVRKLRETDGLEFGNSCYNVEFGDKYQEKKFLPSEPFGIQYQFHLEDAVSCPEWLVHFPTFQALAEEYGLELVFKKNFHEFCHEHIKNPIFAELMKIVGALGHGSSRDRLSDDEWDAAYIYMAFVFKKVGPSHLRNQRGPRRLAGPISQEEILHVE
ncbi:hypothetical protein GOP47_0009959 [Adiantum capillus-veneris]|uniref:mRNA cap guanine-N(7) methyltransferase n=1 Tax=Adiantum capillus-veneris TaxID=13818 RepID=A0A9D4UWC3_ADICA|nr:hypothetical protein GOP47_0009511 [Adiantum capillus-veneris]KAI5075883.1 hypothetical protein GOP47_0009959 [Adiantum capillus-veneris]